MDDSQKLVRLDVTTRWCIANYELEYGDMAVLDAALYERYADDFEIVDPAERAAELLTQTDEGEDRYGYRARLDFLSMIDEVPDSKADEALKERLEEVAGD